MMHAAGVCSAVEGRNQGERSKHTYARSPSGPGKKKKKERSVDP